MSVLDMCDRCGPNIPAAWRFRHPATGAELTMCGHCATINRPLLREAGWHTYRLVRAPASV